LTKKKSNDGKSKKSPGTKSPGTKSPGNKSGKSGSNDKLKRLLSKGKAGALK